MHLPFLVAYRAVDAVIADAEPSETLDAKTVAHRALLLGRQEVVLGNGTTPVSLATALFSSGIALAANAGLMGRGDPSERAEFLTDLR